MGCQNLKNDPYTSSLGGNSWAITLPAGSSVVVQEPARLTPAVNEIENGQCVKDVILVSPAYLGERDEREIELLRVIETLKIRKDVP